MRNFYTVLVFVYALGFQQITRAEETNRVTLVSKAYDSLESANGRSENPVLSYNERFIVFESAASNLIESDTNDNVDVFIYDRLSKSIGLVSSNADGSQLPFPTGILDIRDHDNSSVSNDGKYVLLYSSTGQRNNYFLKNMLTGDLTNLRATLGEKINDAISLSYDGTYLFYSTDTHLYRHNLNNGMIDSKNIADFDLPAITGCDCTFIVDIIGFDVLYNRIVATASYNPQTEKRGILLSYDFNSKRQHHVVLSDYINFDRFQGVAYPYDINDTLSKTIIIDSHYSVDYYLFDLDTLELNRISSGGLNFYAANPDFSIIFGSHTNTVSNYPPNLTTEFGPNGIPIHLDVENNVVPWPYANSYPWLEYGVGWIPPPRPKAFTISSKGDFYVLDTNWSLAYDDNYEIYPGRYDNDIYIWNNNKPFVDYETWKMNRFPELFDDDDILLLTVPLM